MELVFSIKHFRPYLFGRKFYVITDHRPLVWMQTHKDPNSRIMRWRLTLAEYDFEVIYRPGKTNVADALSRNLVERVVTRSTALTKKLKEQEQEGDTSTTQAREEDTNKMATRSAAAAEKLKEQENEAITEHREKEDSYNIVTRGRAAREHSTGNTTTGQERAPEGHKKGRRLREQERNESETPIEENILRENEDKEENKQENSIVDETRSEEKGQTLINQSNTLTGKDTEDKPLNQIHKTSEEILNNPIVSCREKLFMRKDNYLFYYNRWHTVR